ncbi:uncharacterized protein EKO05_0001132 [Ascochyta rabiei]|uniref:uncharacterized protein n=1 Tax=Didymella rabiei TaxID=5454 RepID=UPI002204BF91|nr:uncharacterized protein EKO05_0001132 [Ascochyta rabiei]UPX10474.1 hypothetical protein EKO05_0001132 [Ascochyta rabiei]
MSRSLQRRRQSMRRLHSSQPPSSLEQHILVVLDQLQTIGCVLGNDVILCFPQATQFGSHEGFVVVDEATELVTT